MTHVLFVDTDDSDDCAPFVMVCGEQVTMDDAGSGTDFVGIGYGIIRDGAKYTAAEQLALVDCPGCLDCFVGTQRRGPPS